LLVALSWAPRFYEEEFDTADLLTVTTVLEERNRK
jgi:hypothetical protein